MKILSHYTRMIVITLVLALVLPFTVGAGAPGCGNVDIRTAAGDVVAGMEGVANLLRVEWGASDPRTEKLNATLQFSRDLEDAISSNDQVKILDVLPKTITSFQQNILPFISTNRNVAIAVAAADTALRIVAKRLKSRVVEWELEQPPAVVATAKSTMKAKGADMDSASTTVDAYLNTPKVEKPK